MLHFLLPRTRSARCGGNAAIFAATLLLVVSLVAPISYAFIHDALEFNPFGASSTKDFDDDFFLSPSPRHRPPSNSDDALRSYDMNDDHRSINTGALRSQNHKYFAKTPAHDKHFATILRQQEAATIKNPRQVAMIANDQMELRDRGMMRNALQTSDDDIYEVESAPVMRSAPYEAMNGRWRRGARGNVDGRRQRNNHNEQSSTPAMQQDEPELDMPMSVSFESNIDHSFNPSPAQTPAKNRAEIKHHPRFAKFMSEDGEPTEHNNNNGYDNHHRRPHTFNQQSSPLHQQSNQQQWKPPRPYQPVENSNAHFSMGAADDNSEESSDDGDEGSEVDEPPQHEQPMSWNEPARRPAVRGKSTMSTYHHTPHYQKQIKYNHITPDEDNFVREKGSPRHARTYSDEGHSSPQMPKSTMMFTQNTPASNNGRHHSTSKASPPPRPMESSWLDMGAYSSGKGAFGWYSDVPVGGPTAFVMKK